MEHVVYVLESDRDGRLYIGVTRDVSSRIKRHNAGRVPSTTHRRPLRLVGTRPFHSFAEARAAEVQLKCFKDPARVRAWIAA